jgi:hypothetical protein
MKMSEWRADRNRQSLMRLTKALPPAFPAPVLIYALRRPFIPPTPRLAIDGYWRAHPLRADRLARALAAKSGTPDGWTWGPQSKDVSFRSPPAPYRDPRFSLGPGRCCVCGQPVYRLGWHCDRWGRGPNPNAEWHACCVIAWRLWNAPSDFVQALKQRQLRRCAQTGARLWKTAEVDHRLPLFQVWREHRQAPWPVLLGYWGAPNLQVINRDVHVAKCAQEAKYRVASAGIRG